MRGAAPALLLLGLLACAPDDTSLRVTGRLAGPVARETRPAVSVEKHRIDTLTRDAIATRVGGAFQVAVEPRDRALLFSIARGEEPDCPAPLRFAVSARVRDRWEPLFAEARGPGESLWSDHRIALGAGGARPDALRFAVDAPAGAPACRDTRAHWGSVVLLGHAGASREPPRPNVVLVSLDTLGASYLSSFGHAPGVSPRIDAFLESGFSFRRAYAQYGYTLPSHASLFSGLYPIRHRVYTPRERVRFDSLTTALARHGYLTAAFTEGAMVSAIWGFADGFDAYDDGVPALNQQLAGGAERTFARAADWLETLGADARFFLFVHSYEVHLPYAPRDREALAVARRLTPGVKRFFKPTLQARATWEHNRGEALLSEAELAHLKALHSAEIQFADRVFGGFLERLEALGLADRTLVVLTSDHGDQFGERGMVSHGESLHNRVLHVPLGFRWPGRIARGTSDEPVQLVDVMPTIFELARLPTPPGLDGRSLAPRLRGEPAGEPRPAISEQRHGRGACVRRGLGPWCRLDRYAVQDARFKLVSSRVPEREELFDLREDPLETRDVSAQHPDEVLRLQQVLRDYVAREASAPEARETAPLPLDEAVQQRLEALGYVD